MFSQELDDTIVQEIIRKEGIENINYLGAGGVGMIIEATHPMHKRVAIKYPYPTYSKRKFKQRIRLIERESHIEDYFLEQRVKTMRCKKGDNSIFLQGILIPYIIQEFIEGKDANSFFSKQRSESQTLEVLEGIAQNIKEFHDKGIIRRDGTLSNYIIMPGNPIEVRGIDAGTTYIGDRYDLIKSMMRRLPFVPPRGKRSYLPPDNKNEWLDKQQLDIYIFGKCLSYILFSGTNKQWEGSLAREIKELSKVCCEEYGSILTIDEVIDELDILRS